MCLIGLILLIINEKAELPLIVIMFLFTILGGIGFYLLKTKVYNKISRAVEEH